MTSVRICWWADMTVTEYQITRTLSDFEMVGSLIPPGHLIGNELFRMMASFDDFPAIDFGTLLITVKPGGPGLRGVTLRASAYEH